MLFKKILSYILVLFIPLKNTLRLAARLFQVLPRKKRKVLQNLIPGMSFLTGFIFFCPFFCFAENTGPQGSAQSEAQRAVVFSLSDVTALALKNNIDIKIAKLNALISHTDLENNYSVFDAILALNAGYTEDELDKGTTILGERAVTNEYGAELNKKLPTGTTLGLAFSDKRSFSDSPFITINPSHDAETEFSVTQAIGKNAFGMIDRGTIAMTKLAIENADLDSLDKIENSTAEAQKAYWRLALAQENVALEKTMIEKAVKLYEINKENRDMGIIEEPDLLASEANVSLRETELLIVENALKDAVEELKLLLNLKTEFPVITRERLDFQPVSVSFEQALKEAISSRRDYRQAKNDVEKMNINLRLKKNSLWPQIDLEATWKRNGLDRNFSESVNKIGEEDNSYYYAGVDFKLPLENRDARSNYKKADFQKARALLVLKKAEEDMAVDIDEAVRKVSVSAETYHNRLNILALQKRKLDEEFKLYFAGRSSSFMVINYQEDLLLAEFRALKAAYDYKIAVIDLKLAQNSLLNELGIKNGIKN